MHREGRRTRAQGWALGELNIINEAFLFGRDRGHNGKYYGGHVTNVNSRSEGFARTGYFIRPRA